MKYPSLVSGIYQMAQMFNISCIDGSVQFQEKYLKTDSKLVADYIEETGTSKIEVPFTQEAVSYFIDYLATLVSIDTKEKWIQLLTVTDYFGVTDKYQEILEEQFDEFIDKTGITLYPEVDYTFPDYIAKLRGEPFCAAETEVLLPKIRKLRQNLLDLENGKGPIVDGLIMPPTRDGDKAGTFKNVFNMFSMVKDMAKDTEIVQQFQHMGPFFAMIELINKAKVTSDEEFLSLVMGDPTYVNIYELWAK